MRRCSPATRWSGLGGFEVNAISENTKVFFTLTRAVVIGGSLLGAGWLARDRVSEFDKGVDMKLAVMSQAIREVATKDFVEDKLNAAAEFCYRRTSDDLQRAVWPVLCPEFPTKGRPQRCKLQRPRDDTF